ncbi:MAG: putative Ig domain-containing protein [Acidimicrobiia bacterium]
MIVRRLTLLVLAFAGLIGLPVLMATSASAAVSSGYWMLDSQGRVYAFGAAGTYGPATITSGAQAVKIESKADGTGAWVVDSRGNVSAFGTAVKHSATSPTLNAGESIVTMARTASGNGYWLISSRGRTFNYGDAADVGDVTDYTVNNAPLNKPVIDAAKAVTGNGVYLVAEDGGVFTMGDARFYGSTGNLTLNSPVKSLVPDPDGVGYWLIAGDGGVFSFDAPFRGSMGGTTLNGPVVGMVSFGNGYLQVGSDGGIFTFTDLPFFGSLGGQSLPASIVSVAAFSYENSSATVSGSFGAVTVGTTMSAQFTQSGLSGTPTWSASGLPDGLSIDASTGVVSGRPGCLATNGTATISATAAGTTASRSVAFTVNALPYAGTGNVQRITNGNIGGYYLSRAVLSNDGCVVAFESKADLGGHGPNTFGATTGDPNSSDSDPNNDTDIFVYDRGKGSIERITAGAPYYALGSGHGYDGGNGSSQFASISADGRYVAFSGNAENLDRTCIIPGGTPTNPSNGNVPHCYGIFVVDRLTHTLTRVSDVRAAFDTTAGTQVQISANGSHVVYAQTSRSTAPYDSQVYVWRRSDGLTTQVSYSNAKDVFNYQVEGNAGSDSPTINADGTVVAFESKATNLGADSGDTNGVNDIFVWTSNGNGFINRRGDGTTAVPPSVPTGTIARVTSGNTQSSNWPFIAANGSRIAFVTYATFGGDADATPAGFEGDGTHSFAPNSCGSRTCDEVFVQDADIAYATRPGSSWTTGGTVTRVTNGSSGSFLVGFNASGNTLVFDSHDASPEATTGGEATAGLIIFSKAIVPPGASTSPSTLTYNNAAGSSGYIVRPGISGDGRYMAFSSSANVTGGTDNNAGQGNPLDRFDVFLVARSATAS